MMATSGKNVQHLIVDSGAFIKNAPIKDLGEEIYSVSGVVEEIKDKATRARLQVLPYVLKIKEPLPEYVHAVSEFAKKTGDYRSLSLVDLRVLGLVYQLHRQYIGEEGVRHEPVSKVTMVGSTIISSSGALHKSSACTSEVDGHLNNDKLDDIKESLSKDDKVDTYSEKPGTDRVIDTLDNSAADTSQVSALQDDIQIIISDLSNTTLSNEVCPENSSSDSVIHTDGHSNSSNKVKEETDSSDVKNDGDDDYSSDDGEEEEDADDDDDDDDDGWITPQNFSSVKQTLNDQMTKCERSDVAVACLTTDFAMQNVLLQMGLHLISVDGMLIRRTNSYVLRCTACFKVSSDMQRVFCHHCGNKTLRRVATSVNADGTVSYHISRHKKLNTRGLRHTLPPPKGGKRANNPILCEDQRPSQSQKSSAKSRNKYEALSDDYVANVSPFAPIDVNSRAAFHKFTAAGHKQRGGGGVGRGGRRNPNENAKVYGRRK